ncbi:hypothetical protein [Cupriavidus campinensis]|uniref:hypothetical protein n=1 Tax=Cupriavidus campinensis TaxID=151783 RepID=UPI001642436E|nr:hypothetical protein [Cupriavidus campinensis]
MSVDSHVNHRLFAKNPLEFSENYPLDGIDAYLLSCIEPRHGFSLGIFMVQLRRWSGKKVASLVCYSQRQLDGRGDFAGCNDDAPVLQAQQPPRRDDVWKKQRTHVRICA